MTALGLTPWHKVDFAVLDFETDGVDAGACMPVSVAAVRYSGGVEVEHFTSLLNPGRPIPAEATAIHKITDEMVANAPTFADIQMAVQAVMVAAIPVAYNAEYDCKVLGRVCSPSWPSAGLDLTSWICPLVMIRGIDRRVPGPGRHRLETTCKRWGVEMGGAHNALADARATGRLLWKMKPTLGDISVEKLLAAIAQRRVEQERDFQNYKARMERQKAAAQ